MNNQKIPVAILGATGMVGQRLITLLQDHPWFEIVCLAASAKSAGKTYGEAVQNRWALEEIPAEEINKLVVYSIEKDIEKIAENAKLVFSAFDADKDFIKNIEETYAAAGLAVVSNNSAHRWTDDVPMVMPEINPGHLEMIDVQRNNRGWDSGCIIVKPNCSIQSYVPLLTAWQEFEPHNVIVSTYQAISGAGKTFDTWPEMLDNVIPFIGGEEEKSENEPSKIWAKVKNGEFKLQEIPEISANCFRVPVLDGHMAAINLGFKKDVSKEKLISAIKNFENPLRELGLPSAPEPFLTYFEDENRPQTKLDRNLHGGMGISIGRLRNDPILGWKCAALSHNTLRGAAGGSVLSAELLVKKGYVK